VSPVDRKELQRLAKERVAEAKILLAARKWSGAYYLVGYAVELALKACLAKRVKAEDFPDKSIVPQWWTHSVEQLLTVADLKRDRDADSRSDSQLFANWETVKDWKETSRYETKTKSEAYALYDAITDSKHGVMPWISLRW
jgi:HEPN domain-containing protein